MVAASHSMSSAAISLKADEGWKAPQHLKAFRVLGIDPRFNLDLDALEAHVLDLQCQHHPDRVAPGADEATKAAAQERFADIAWAFAELKDPKTRASLLFKANGLWPAPHNQAVLAELFQAEEDAADDTYKSPAIAADLKKAEVDLGRFLDQGAWSDAGTAFMRMNGLRRLWDRASGQEKERS